LELEEVMGRLMVPTLFLTSPDDVTVNSDHSLSLFNRCMHSRKKLAYIKGLHNEARDGDYLKEVKSFIEAAITESRKQPVVSQIKLNKFELIPSERRNFSVEANEWDSNNECYCSLFPSPEREPGFMDAIPTTRRKQS
jgi:hypothetical protein